MKVNVNMNASCSAVLAERGAEILNRKLGEHVQKHSAGDVYQAQLWCLFNDFGIYINMDCEVTFVDNTITIDGRYADLMQIEGEENKG